MAQPEVLPRLPLDLLIDAMRRVPADELEEVLRHRILRLINLPDLTLFVACSPRAVQLAHAHGLRLVAFATPEDFHEALRLTHAQRLLEDSTLSLSRNRPELSAARRMSWFQATIGFGICLGMLAAAFLLPASLTWSLASIVSAFFFLAVIALRLLCLLPPLPRPKTIAPVVDDDDLPVYTVLVPLHREVAVLHQLLEALDRLDYPPEKLDIKLLLEQDDMVMVRALAPVRFPDHVEVIIVPAGLPQTKPRALCYGLRFARGELLTIYDAEDIPSPGQLRIAAETFRLMPGEVACLQAELAFFNARENWLTKQFTIEYATLFGLLLPTLANYSLPLPLGGTSNHFRVKILREVGGWDPFNVTEDADLGIRLARAGYQTGTIPSITWEEANTRPLNWLRQRARWLKGFLATWFVHMRQPVQLFQELGPSGFWVMQCMTIGVFASALLHPLCMIGTLLLFFFGPSMPEKPGMMALLVNGVGLMVLVMGYAAMMIAGVRGLHRLGHRGWIAPIASMPVYWFLMSCAAWLALWQFIWKPHHWNKTEHGITRLRRHRGKPHRALRWRQVSQPSSGE